MKQMKKKVLVGSFSSALAHGLVSVSDGIIDLDKHISEIASQIFEYTCSKCGKKFELPFKLFANQTPLCKDCIKVQ